MPARVHALLVVRPDGRVPADLHLKRTLAALSAQSRTVDALTIVLCGTDAAVRAVAVAAVGADAILTAGRRTSFAQALQLATPRLDGDAVWLLAQDTAPAPEALARLSGALEAAPSLALVAPKLVRWEDHARIVSLGVSLTRFGRTVELADGDWDQGQHDATEDVLGVDVRGALVLADAWHALAGIDPGLSGADEGIDLAIRARLAGGRVALAATAVVAVAGDGVAGLPRGHEYGPRARRAFQMRAAALHRRLVYAPAAAVPLHWLSLLPLAIWRALGHLLGKAPGLILPEWAATLVALVRVVGVAKARIRIRRQRRAGWAQLAPLRVTGREIRHRLDSDADDAAGRELRFFSGGGAWIVLAALVVSVAALPALLAWPALGGGALAPLGSTVRQLWADAAFGPRALGWDTSGPADPFSIVMALLGSLAPWNPSRAVVVLWVLALPLAALGGWFAATRVTDRSPLRAVGAIAWALSPAVLAALVDGRPAAVLAHLLLPWLLYAASVAHRSWTGAGVASLVLAALLACAPALAPAFAVLWLVAIVLTAIVRRGAGLARIVWLVVPSLVVFAPTVWHRLGDHDLVSLLADPGVPWAGDSGPVDLLRRAFLTLGFPTGDPGGWSGMLGPDATVWWVPLLIVPILLLALAAPLSRRPIVASILLATAVVGIGTAQLVVGLTLSATGTAAVPLWSGPALSLAWLGMTGAAVLALDAVPGIRPARLGIAAVAVAALAVVAAPMLTANARGAGALTNGPGTTLPAFVAAEGRTGSGTIVLTPLPGGAVDSDVVWGESETLGGQSTLQSARAEATAADREVAAVTADLMTESAADVVGRLAGHGIAFVVLATPADDDESVRTASLAAQTALDQRDGLDAVGETARGTLWRVTADVRPRVATEAQEDRATAIAGIQLGVVVIALLLALPTGATRRAARRLPRVVGVPRREGR